jgi:hypothetical protein
MSKLIIWIGGKPLLNGYRIRDFHWAVAHNCYIYEGKELDESEFNVAFEKAFRNNMDLHPKVKVVGMIAPPAKPVAPVAHISASKEITLDQAVAVVAELAPDKLKRPLGRPAKVLEVA